MEIMLCSLPLIRVFGSGFWELEVRSGFAFRRKASASAGKRPFGGSGGGWSSGSSSMRRRGSFSLKTSRNPLELTAQEIVKIPITTRYVIKHSEAYEMRLPWNFSLM